MSKELMIRRENNITEQFYQNDEIEILPVNGKAKARLFTKIYEDVENRRSLAKFLTGRDFKENEIANVSPILFGNKENDLAFLCDQSLIIMIEEQSYYCANIAYRILEYVVAALRSTVDSEKMLYGSTLVKFPTPKLYVVNVGLLSNTSEIPDVEYDIKLSDSFREVDDYNLEPIMADLELTVHVYDFRMTYDEIFHYIDKGQVPSRMTKYDNELFQYALTANSIAYIQQYISVNKKVNLKSNKKLKRPSNVNGVIDIINLLRDRGVLTQLLYDQEVVDMTMATFSRDDMIRYAAEEEGIVKGLTLISKVRNGELDILDAAKEANISVEEFKKYL